MNAIMNKTNNGKRLIAAAIALAMIVCALALVATPSDATTTGVVDSSDYEGVKVTTTIPTADQIATEFETKDVIILAPTASGTIADDVVIPAGKILIIGDAYSANSSGAKITFSGNVTVNGTLYNNLGDMKSNSGVIFANGSHLTMGTTGVVYSTCAFNWEGTGQITGFFTNSNGALGTEYRHIYAGNINSLIPYVNAVKYSDTASTAVKAIYTYGDVTIGQNTTLNDLTLYIGGVGANNESTLTVAKGANLTVNSTAKVTLAANNKDTSSVINNGTIGVYGTYNATTDSTNGSVRILSETAVYDVNAITGTIDTSAISSEATLSGELQTNNTVFTANQVVTITKDLNLIAGASLIIKGTMIIPEGVTVTIQEGAQLIIDTSTASVENNGTIVIQSYRCGVTSQDGKTFTGMSYTDGNGSKVTYGFAVINGATVENNGTISLEYTMTMDDTGAQDVFDIGAGSTVTNNGTLTVGSESGIIIN